MRTSTSVAPIPENPDLILQSPSSEPEPKRKRSKPRSLLVGTEVAKEASDMVLAGFRVLSKLLRDPGRPGWQSRVG